MDFGHFPIQNTSVKVEISNQVKCHTAQRSRRGAGAQGRRREVNVPSRPLPSPRSPRPRPSAREAQAPEIARARGRLRGVSGKRGAPWHSKGSQELLIAGRGRAEGVEKPRSRRVPPRALGIGSAAAKLGERLGKGLG